MPKMNWTELGTQKLGRCAEYFAMMEFASFGCKIYSAEIDDGVDFVAKINSDFYEVQVKSMLKGKYVYVPKSSMNIHDKFRLVCFLKFAEGELPMIYIIPATSWKRPNAVLKNNAYTKSQKSPPEWGIQYSERNLSVIEKHRADLFFAKHNL